MIIPINTLKAYSVLLPRNEVRYYLNGLHFSKQRNQIECTDGHFMAWEAFDCSELESDIIVPTAVIDDLLKITKEENVELTPNRIGRLEYEPILGKFPDLSRTIEIFQSADIAEDNPNHGYDLRYLALFAKAAVLRNGGKPASPKTVFSSIKPQDIPFISFTSGTFKKDMAFFERNGFKFIVMQLKC